MPLALKPREAWTLLGMSSATFYRVAKIDPTFPAARYVVGERRWLRDELEAWLRAQTAQRMTQREMLAQA